MTGAPLRTAVAAVLAAMLSLLAVCALPAAAHAEDAVELVLAQGAESANEPFAVSGMLPGDRASTDVLVEVRHSEALTVRFSAEAVGESSQLAHALELRLVDRATGGVLYEGTMGGLGAHPFAVELPESEGGSSTLAWRVEAVLPASAGNEHQASRCEIDLHWYVEEGERESLAPLVQTGDWTAFAPLAVLACLALAAMAAWWARSRPTGNGPSDVAIRRKKLIVPAAVLALLAVGALAWALAGHVRLPFNTFETGTVSVELNEGRPVFPEGGASLEPGASLTREFTVTNTGTADAYYRLRLVGAEGGLAQALEATISRDGVELFAGSFSELAEADACASDEILAAGRTDVLTATVRMPAGAGDAYQGADVSFDLQVQAVQARNNEGREF